MCGGFAQIDASVAVFLMFNSWVLSLRSPTSILATAFISLANGNVGLPSPTYNCADVAALIPVFRRLQANKNPNRSRKFGFFMSRN
jgi:hypothetical protein